MRLPDSVIAKPASDKSDDWPAWYVAESYGALNVTGQVATALGYGWPPGAVLTDRLGAEMLAEQWNALNSVQ